MTTAVWRQPVLPGGGPPGGAGDVRCRADQLPGGHGCVRAHGEPGRGNHCHHGDGNHHVCQQQAAQGAPGWATVGYNVVCLSLAEAWPFVSGPRLPVSLIQATKVFDINRRFLSIVARPLLCCLQMFGYKKGGKPYLGRPLHLSAKRNPCKTDCRDWGRLCA